jgi:hypothetical protein
MQIGALFLSIPVVTAAVFTGGFSLLFTGLALPAAGAALGHAAHKNSERPDFRCNYCSHEWREPDK